MERFAEPVSENAGLAVRGSAADEDTLAAMAKEPSLELTDAGFGKSSFCKSFF